MAAPTFLTVGSGASARSIATLVTPAARAGTAGLVWLPGLKSEMTSTKATAVAEWGAARGLAVTRFDYSGHGQSPGRFEDGTIGAWLEEAVAVITALTTGPQVLVGSSMGGYIALLALRQLLRTRPEQAARIKALLLIAPAWDMTERLMWQNFSSEARRQIVEEGVFRRPSAYGDEPYAITRTLIEEGRRHLIGEDAFDPGRPIHIIHGLLDPDVPWEHTLDLVAHLGGDHVQVTAVPDGEHRLSRPEDLSMMLSILEKLVAAP